MTSLAMDWQPIETAPRDGTPILMWLAKKIERHYPADGLCDNICIGLYHHGRWSAVEVEDCGSMGGEYTGWMSDWCHLDVAPTHWMPLPEAP